MKINESGNWRAFRHRNYRILFAANAVSNIGTWAQRIAQDWLVLELTNSGSYLGLVTALQFAPFIFFSLHGGALADRFNKRKVLIWTNIAGGLSAGVLGLLVLTDVVEGAIEFGVKELSAYAFSTENWRRSPDEVKFLMGFNRDVIRRRRDQMNELGVRVRWVGRPKRLWSSVINELEEAEELTAKNKVLTLNMCVNYGGRAEIVDAAAELARDVKRGKLKADSITEKVFAKYLDSPKMSDVDLFLRSSGEQRTSNFLPWQSVYAELVFMDVLWPDVTRKTLWKASTRE